MIMGQLRIGERQMTSAALSWTLPISESGGYLKGRGWLYIKQYPYFVDLLPGQIQHYVVQDQEGWGGQAVKFTHFYDIWWQIYQKVHFKES